MFQIRPPPLSLSDQNISTCPPHSLSLRERMLAVEILRFESELRSLPVDLLDIVANYMCEHAVLLFGFSGCCALLSKSSNEKNHLSGMSSVKKGCTESSNDSELEVRPLEAKLDDKFAARPHANDITFNSLEWENTAGNRLYFEPIASPHLPRFCFACVKCFEMVGVNIGMLGVVIIGGTNKSDSLEFNLLRSCEIYYPRLDAWHSLPSLSRPVASAAACVVGNRIFLFGGQITKQFDLEPLEAQPLVWSDCISYFDIQTRTWHDHVANIPEILQYPKVSALRNNRVLVTGTRLSEHSCGECFAPESACHCACVWSGVWDMQRNIWFEAAHPHPPDGNEYSSISNFSLASAYLLPSCSDFAPRLAVNNHNIPASSEDLCYFDDAVTRPRDPCCVLAGGLRIDDHLWTMGCPSAARYSDDVFFLSGRTPLHEPTSWERLPAMNARRAGFACLFLPPDLLPQRDASTNVEAAIAVIGGKWKNGYLEGDLRSGEFLTLGPTSLATRWMHGDAEMRAQIEIASGSLWCDLPSLPANCGGPLAAAVVGVLSRHVDETMYPQSVLTQVQAGLGEGERQAWARNKGQEGLRKRDRENKYRGSNAIRDRYSTDRHVRDRHVRERHVKHGRDTSFSNSSDSDHCFRDRRSNLKKSKKAR
jgi:hypothetical protein